MRRRPRPAISPRHLRRKPGRFRTMTAHRFMFATGIENSYPTIKHGSIRVDETGEGRPLQALGDRLRARRGSRTSVPALWPADPPHLAGSRPLRLGLRRPDIRPLEAPRHRADCRSLPLRRAGLDRRLPEPRVPAPLCRVRPRLCRALSMGAALHTGQRDLRLRHVLGRLRLVERAAARATGPL